MRPSRRDRLCTCWIVRAPDMPRDIRVLCSVLPLPRKDNPQIALGLCIHQVFLAPRDMRVCDPVRAGTPKTTHAEDRMRAVSAPRELFEIGRCPRIGGALYAARTTLAPGSLVARAHARGLILADRISRSHICSFITPPSTPLPRWGSGRGLHKTKPTVLLAGD